MRFLPLVEMTFGDEMMGLLTRPHERFRSFFQDKITTD